MRFGTQGIRAFSLVLRLDDYLWFASHEWGNDNETAPVLHNYALSFALDGRERVFALGGVPNYKEDLDGLDVYSTPARLRREGMPRAVRTAFTFNSVDNPTHLTQALRIGEKVNDPKFGKRQVLVPGLRFECVAFARGEGLLPRVFRLGKKRSPVVVESSNEVTGSAVRRSARPSHAVNPLDVVGQVARCVIRSIPPHMVYEDAEIVDDDFLIGGNDVVHVPRRVKQWFSS